MRARDLRLPGQYRDVLSCPCFFDDKGPQLLRDRGRSPHLRVGCTSVKCRKLESTACDGSCLGTGSQRVVCLWLLQAIPERDASVLCPTPLSETTSLPSMLSSESSSLSMRKV